MDTTQTTEQPTKTISAREFRELLFMVKEGTTVYELRQALFAHEPHDEQVELAWDAILRLAPTVYG